MLHSHNSYWIDGDPVKVSVQAGCDIIEADIINADLDLGHSWRPARWMYYGNLKDRYLKKFPKDKYLYIEFKTGDRQVLKPLYDSLKKSGVQNILIGASDHLLIDRLDNCLAFLKEYRDKLNLTLFTVFNQTVNIESVDLYKRSIFHF